jgi:lipopolysaccharide transport system ATP-binding protein
VTAPAATPTGQFALEVDHVSKKFRRRTDGANSLKQLLVAAGRRQVKRFTALDDVTFAVRRGEVFGVIGHNGSGKSTLLKCMAGILQPTSGTVTVHDRMSALLELGAGFHPDLSGRDNVFLNAALLGMRRKEIADRYDEIVEFSGLDREFLDAPVKTYSSGMYVRLAFAIAINVDPQLLIVDEILAVGDVTFQRKCLDKFVEFRNSGRTIVLVTHDLGSVQSMCDRAVWLDHGVVRGMGDPSDMVEGYSESMVGVDESSRQRTLGTSRSGSGEAEFTAVELFAADGSEPVKRCRTGDDVVVRLRYQAHSPVRQPVFSIAVSTTSGIVITSPSTREADAVPAEISGDGEVTVRLSGLPLLPGHYHLHCSLTDYHRQHVIDYVHSATTFDVLAGNPHEPYGTVTLHPAWTVR